MAPSSYGTLVTSAIALILASPPAFGAAIFLLKIAPHWIGALIAFE